MSELSTSSATGPEADYLADGRTAEFLGDFQLATGFYQRVALAESGTPRGAVAEGKVRDLDGKPAAAVPDVVGAAHVLNGLRAEFGGEATMARWCYEDALRTIDNGYSDVFVFASEKVTFLQGRV